MLKQVLLVGLLGVSLTGCIVAPLDDHPNRHHSGYDRDDRPHWNKDRPNRPNWNHDRPSRPDWNQNRPSHHHR